MASQTLTAGTITSESYGSINWTNPNNSKVEDGSLATATDNGVGTYLLRSSNYGFSIPSGATIDGIECEAKLSGSNANGIEQVYLALAGTTQFGADRGSSWPTSLQWQSFGGSSDLWSQTPTDSDINNSGFGFSLGGYASVGTITLSVDSVRITVYYTMPGTSVDDSDSATGADASTSTAAYVEAEAPTGSDASSLAATTDASEASTGAEAQALAAVTDSAEVSTGSDTQDLAAAVGASDVASGLEEGSVALEIGASEIAVGVDNESVASDFITLKRQVTHSHTTTSLVTEIATDTGSALIACVAVAQGGSQPVTVTDDAGNTWIRAEQSTQADWWYAEIWYTLDAEPVTEVTVGANVLSLMSVNITEWTGIAEANVLDGTSIQNGSHLSSPNLPGITTTLPNILLIGMHTAGTPDATLPTGGFTELEYSVPDHGSLGRYAYKIVDETGIYWTTWPSLQGQWAASQVAFRGENQNQSVAETALGTDSATRRVLGPLTDYKRNRIWITPVPRNEIVVLTGQRP